MRTTLTLDEDNADRLRELSQRMRRPFKRVVNDVIRQGLQSTEVQEEETPYRVDARPMSLRPGLDAVRLSQLESDLDLENFEKTTARIRKGK